MIARYNALDDLGTQSRSVKWTCVQQWRVRLERGRRDERASSPLTQSHVQETDPKQTLCKVISIQHRTPFNKQRPTKQQTMRRQGQKHTRGKGPHNSIVTVKRVQGEDFGHFFFLAGFLSLKPWLTIPLTPLTPRKAIIFLNIWIHPADDEATDFGWCPWWSTELIMKAVWFWPV